MTERPLYLRRGIAALIIMGCLGWLFAGPISPAQADTPTNTAPPTVSGVPLTGNTLTATTGTWTGSNLSYRYQWVECWDQMNSSDCFPAFVNSGSTTASTFTPGQNQIDQYLRVAVTASNSSGSVTVYSPATAIVTAPPPVNSSAPQLGGQAQAGRVMTIASFGNWSPTDVQTSVESWLACDAQGNNCQPVDPDQPDFPNSFRLTDDLVGQRIEAVVQAVDPETYVSATATTALSAVITARPTDEPTNITVPTISSTLYAGWTAQANPGTWGGDSGTDRYQWQSCQSSGWPEYTTTCSDIPGATSQNYSVQPSDVGNELQVQVTDTNNAGSDSQVSFPQ
jgi:hypothetical protein